MFFAIGKAALKRALKMARNSPGSAVAIGGSTFVVAETIGESTPGYRFFAAETQREAAAKWQRKNEAIIEAGRALIRTLSPEGFLRQRYSEHSVGRQQMKVFLRDWIEAGWPHFSGEVVSAMGVRVYDAIMAEVERANTAAVWLKAPETAPIESDDAPEYDVEQARVALWNKAMGMDPPAMADPEKPSGCDATLRSVAAAREAIKRMEVADNPGIGLLDAGINLLGAFTMLRDREGIGKNGFIFMLDDNARLKFDRDGNGAIRVKLQTTFDAEAATLDDGVGMWGWKESARIMPTNSRKTWIWVCRPGATESRLMRASDFHGIEPKMRVEYWRHAETPTPPKR